VSREAERVAEVAALIGQRLGSAMKDVLPPEAQTHLLNAQRELLTALFLIYEHQMGARRPEPAARKRSRSRAAERRPRVQRIEIE
jgi:hypothetical protein